MRYTVIRPGNHYASRLHELGDAPVVKLVTPRLAPARIGEDPISPPPGVGLPFTEIHDEEHGLYMTAGSGTYVLDGDEHEVAAGDFIYMAPYCPQGFTAVEAAEYLLYKDTWRDGF